MKQSIILIAILISSYSMSFSQFSKQGHKEVAKMKSGTTIIPYSPDEEFNERFEEIIKENWTFNKFKFVPYEGFKEYADNKNNSFLLFHNFFSASGTSSSNGNSFYTGDLESIRVDVNNGYITNHEVYDSQNLTLQFGKYFFQPANWASFVDCGDGFVDIESEKLVLQVRLIQQALKKIQQEKLKKISLTNGKGVYPEEIKIGKRKVIIHENDFYIKTLRQSYLYFHRNEKSTTPLPDNTQAPLVESDFFEVVSDERFKELLEEENTDYLFYGTYTEGTGSTIFLSDYQGKIKFCSVVKRGAMSMLSTRAAPTPLEKKWWEKVAKLLTEKTDKNFVYNEGGE